MTHSRLMYARNLVKEEMKLEQLLIHEHTKRSRNYEKLKKMQKLKKEVESEKLRLNEEVEEWISKAPASDPLKNEMKRYFIEGKGSLSPNFHRDVACLLDENKSYRYEKKSDETN